MTSSQVVTFSETWLLLALLDMFGRLSFPSTAVYSWSTLQQALRDRVALGQVEADDLIRKLYYAYTEVGEPHRRVLDKTPRYYLVADELLRIFPKCRIIVITRDVNDILTSIRATWGRGRLKLSHNWIDLKLGLRLLDSFIRRHEQDDRVLVLAYEDLQSGPERIEEELKQFLDLPDIRFSALGEMTIPGTLGDPSNRRSTEIMSRGRKSRTTLVQHWLVKWISRRELGEHWRKGVPELTYDPRLNAMDCGWLAASLLANLVKLTQFRLTVGHPYKWS